MTDTEKSIKKTELLMEEILFQMMDMRYPDEMAKDKFNESMKRVNGLLLEYIDSKQGK